MRRVGSVCKRPADGRLHGTRQQLLAKIGLHRGKVADKRDVGSRDGNAHFFQRCIMWCGDKITQFLLQGVWAGLGWLGVSQLALVALDRPFPIIPLQIKFNDAKGFSAKTGHDGRLVVQAP